MGRINLSPPAQSAGGDTTQLEADLAAVDGRLNTLEDEFLPMRMLDSENLVDAHTSTLANHESRLDGAENDILAVGGAGGGPAIVVVEHGSDPNYARPPNRLAVYWIGSVAPNNAEDQDLWYSTA